MISDTDKTGTIGQRPGKKTGRLMARAIAEASAEMIGSRTSMQAVIYLRVSSKAQVNTDYDSEGFSLPAQRDACTRKARSLGAAVVGEFVEAGESGTSTKRRKALSGLLTRVAEGDIDYVIVHKVDRLARRRVDDVAITEAIRGSGARLISVSENIDETPSGMLLHGIMASIGEFYSMNLAAEVMKGTTEKARRGGTPFQAPVGYLNVRELVEGREIRTVGVDSERGPLIAQAFRLYATGDYSLSELTAIMEAEGLTSRQTAKRAAAPLGNNDLSHLLRNDYYIGVVRYAGIVSAGRHKKLIDEETFEKVQELLSSRRISGERCWRHHNYLRGSVFCGECSSRLIYTRATGRNGGVYEYFVCHGKSKGRCCQPHHRVEAVEQAIEREYANVQLSPTGQDKIRNDIRDYVAQFDGQGEPERREITANLKRLATQERKLLEAHYQDHISAELFAEEQRRIRHERIAAERRQQELDVDHGRTLEQLDQALRLTSRIQAAYLLAEPSTRRLLNQAIFEGFWVEREDIARAAIKPPFDQLLAQHPKLSAPHQPMEAVVIEPEPEAWELGQMSETPGQNDETRNQVALVTGSNVEKVVEPTGIEPVTSCVQGRRSPS
jgi:site-specific DNA recombinase